MEHKQLKLNQALWKAVKEADVERVEVLLNQGADPLGSLDENDLASVSWKNCSRMHHVMSSWMR